MEVGRGGGGAHEATHAKFTIIDSINMVLYSHMQECKTSLPAPRASLSAVLDLFDICDLVTRRCQP